MKEKTLKNKNLDPDIISFDDDDLLISDYEENLSNDLETQIVEQEKSKMYNSKTVDYNEYADFDSFNDFVKFEIKNLNETEIMEDESQKYSDDFIGVQIDLHKIDIEHKEVEPHSEPVKVEDMVNVDGDSIDKYFGENDDILLSEHTKQMEMLRGNVFTNTFDKFTSTMNDMVNKAEDEHLNNLDNTDLPVDLNLDKKQMDDIEKTVEMSKNEEPQKDKKLFGLNLNKEDYVPELDLDLMKKEEVPVDTSSIEKEVMAKTIEKKPEQNQSFLDMIIRPAEEVDRTKSRISSTEINDFLNEENFSPVNYDKGTEIDAELGGKRKKEKKPLFGAKKEKPLKEPKKKKPPKQPKEKKKKKSVGDIDQFFEQPTLTPVGVEVPGGAAVMEPMGPPVPPVPPVGKPPKKVKPKKEKKKKEPKPKKEKAPKMPKTPKEPKVPKEPKTPKAPKPKKEKKPMDMMSFMKILCGLMLADVLINLLNIFM